MKNPLKVFQVVGFAFFLCVVSAPHLLCSEGKAFRVSISDFDVQSKNPQFEFIGKGFTEFIGIDLAKSRKVTLIDRQKRIELLKEQAFALSGAADEKNNIAIGKLLSADYLITGNIFDFGDNLTVTFRISDTTTGEIIFEDKVADKLSKYDRISSQAAEKILTYLKIQLPRDLVAKANMPQEEKSQEVAINFSKAVDAYDRKDFKKAEKDLKAAKKLDPGNTAVNIYINKLFVNTTKFKVMPEFYVSYQNPAYLGLLKQDKAYVSISNMAATDEVVVRTADDGVFEDASKVSGGYFFPLTFLKDAGFGVEALHFDTIDAVLGSLGDPNLVGYRGSGLEIIGNNDVSYNGVVFTAGFKLFENLAVGAGFTSYNKNRSYHIKNQLANGNPNPNATNPRYIDKNTSGIAATTIGVLLKNTNNTLFLDSYYSSTDQKGDFYSITTGNFTEYKMPAIMENTATYAFNRKKTFAVLKYTSYIYSGLNSSMSRLTPAAEHWFSNKFALRLGAEFSKLKLNGEESSGSGVTAGTTLSFKKFDLDVNFTNRDRPSRNLSDLSVNENVLFITFSTNNGIFFGSKK